MLITPLTTTSRRVILKIERPDYPHLVAHEYLHLTRARALKIPVATASVIHDRAGTPGQMVERFDRVSGPDGPARRLALTAAAMIDLAVLPFTGSPLHGAEPELRQRRYEFGEGLPARCYP